MSRGQSVRPELLEQFNPLVSPGHESSPLPEVPVPLAESALAVRRQAVLGVTHALDTQGTVRYDMSY